MVPVVAFQTMVEGARSASPDTQGTRLREGWKSQRISKLTFDSLFKRDYM